MRELNTDLVLVAAAVEHEAEVGEVEGCEQAQARVRRQNAQRPLQQHHPRIHQLTQHALTHRPVWTHPGTYAIIGMITMLLAGFGLNTGVEHSRQPLAQHCQQRRITSDKQTANFKGHT